MVQMKTLKCVSEYPDDTTTAAKFLEIDCTPQFILPSLLHTRDSCDVIL